MCRCIPYRYKQDVDGNISDELEVLVVSSQKGQGLMFPKVHLRLGILFDNSTLIFFSHDLV